MEEVKIKRRSEQLLKTYYYTKGYTFGRDGLFHSLQKAYPKTHPTKEEIAAWLKNQKLAQLYAQTRKGGTTNRFHPTTPWQSISFDLIDFVNKPAKGYAYILVMIDNFSRYMVTEPMKNKTAKVTAVAFRAIIDRINSQFKKPTILTGLTDDGSEFKADVILLMDKLGIRKIRTLGGNPQQNGLVERSNGKVKMLISKLQEINGGSWADHLEKATAIYNEQFNRGTGYSPSDSVLFTDKERQVELRKNVSDAYKPKVKGTFVPSVKFETGDKVRVKLNKGKLDKASTPNWSASLYTIQKIIPARGTMAEKYQIKEKDADLRYSRNDLQKVVGTPDAIPERPKKPTTRLQAVHNQLATGAFTRAKEKVKEALDRPPPKRLALRERAPPKVAKNMVSEANKNKKKKKQKNTSGVYKAERIVGSREKDGKLQYKVKWEGYKATTFTDASESLSASADIACSRAVSLPCPSLSPSSFLSFPLSLPPSCSLGDLILCFQAQNS